MFAPLSAPACSHVKTCWVCLPFGVSSSFRSENCSGRCISEILHSDSLVIIEEGTFQVWVIVVVEEGY